MRATLRRWTLRAVVVAVAAMLTPLTRVGAERQVPEVHTIEARVPVAPAVVSIDGRPHLVHELHLTNLRREPVEVVRVTVREGAAPPLVDLSGQALIAALIHAGVARDPAATPTLAPGRRAVVYVWRALGGSPPAHVIHDIEVAVPSAVPALHTVVTTAAVPVSTAAPVVLGPPLAGGPWVAIYDPLLMGGHRTTLIALDGVARIPARFAVDWIKAPSPGTPSPPNAAPDFNGAGSDVLAVAEGVVVARRDGVADQPAGVSRTPQPLSLAAGSGNHVVLDIGAGRFVVYEHLQQGSVRVTNGARVRRGQVIAALGSSGSTSIGPHLHFHVADAGSTLAAEGLPWTLDRVIERGRYSSLDALMRGEAWQTTDRVVRPEPGLPAPMSVVEFGVPPPG